MVNFLSFLAMAATEADGTASTGSKYTIYIWLIAMVLFFYFLIIRPQKKKEKQEREMRSSIEPGDNITTIGGFTGRVLSVKDDTITFETGPDRIKLTISKYAIAKSEGTGDKASKEEKPAKKEEKASKEERDSTKNTTDE